MNMNKYFLFFPFVLFFCSCKTHPYSSRSYAGDGKVYKLRLNPPPGSNYHFQVSNEQSLDEEVDGKTIRNEKNTDVGIDYAISKDTGGNLLLTMTYDKLKMHTRSGDNIADLDAANGPTSIDPTEQMLAAL